MDRPGHTTFDTERRAEALLRQGGEDGALDQARAEQSPRRNEDREPDQVQHDEDDRRSPVSPVPLRRRRLHHVTHGG